MSLADDVGADSRCAVVASIVDVVITSFDRESWLSSPLSSKALLKLAVDSIISVSGDDLLVLCSCQAVAAKMKERHVSCRQGKIPGVFRSQMKSAESQWLRMIQGSISLEGFSIRQRLMEQTYWTRRRHDAK